MLSRNYAAAIGIPLGLRASMIIEPTIFLVQAEILFSYVRYSVTNT